MKFLILPDVHNRWEKAEKIIKSVKPDKTIFLGDYFDDFGDDPGIIADVADWFRHSVNQKDRIHLVGNHDTHYWFAGNRALRCSGYEQFKAVAINDFVKKEDWEKLEWFYVLDNRWLLSHAGVHPSWLDPQKFKANIISEYSLDTVVKKLKGDVADAERAFYADKMHWFAMPGFSRSRNSPYYGGLTWCDWTQEFHPIRGVHQLVGHTPSYNVTWNVVERGAAHRQILSLEEVESPMLTDDSSYNLCLDSQPGSKYYAIYDNQQLTVHNADNLK
jgi:hypothetical protein